MTTEEIISDPTDELSSSTTTAAATTTTTTATSTASLTTTTTTSRLSGESTFEQQTHCRLLEELQTLRESETRLKQQYDESQRRERILVRRLAVKEQEMQDYATQITELKAAQAPGPTALRSALLDPAINILFQKLKSELQSTRARLEETQNELSAWKFTPDSNTGKRLMAKCRLLYQENEELGKMTSNGRLAKLEGDLALQKSFSEVVKKSQSELDDVLQELDEDVEGMQSTILFLQQELKTSKDTILSLEQENNLLKNGINDNSMDSTTTAPATDLIKHNKNGDGGGTVEDEEEEEEGGAEEDEAERDEESSNSAGLLNGNSSNMYNCTDNGNNVITITNCSVILRNSDKDVKLSNSERILRKDKLQMNQLNSNNNSLKNEPRTLRSSSRNVTVDDSRTTKLNKTNSFNGSESNNDDLVSNGVSADSCKDGVNEDGVNLVDNNYVRSNNKRNYDSDSSECSNIKLKKGRRSSVLSLDLNEEDSQIEEIDDERAIVTTNGTKNGRTIE